MCDDLSIEPVLTEECPGGEATYSLSDQPTNQPTDQPPTDSWWSEYISIRVTLDHARERDVRDVFDTEHSVIFPHLGQNKDNPHYHILVLVPRSGNAKKVAEKLRKRIKDQLGVSGAGKLMVKVMSNDVTEAITYCAKEGTDPIDPCPDLDKICKIAPKWVDKVQQPIQQYLKGTAPRKPINEDHFYQITYQNMEKVTLRYHRRHGTPPDLASTLEHMHKNGWRLNVGVIRGGIPSTFFDEFEAKCKDSTIWKKSRFEFMRVVPNYSRGL